MWKISSAVVQVAGESVANPSLSLKPRSDPKRVMEKSKNETKFS